jgi:hypothetical protein
MKKIKHSKYKNTGLIFEMLVRQITVDALNGETKSEAARIIREYYKDTELAKEYSLYNVLMSEDFSDPSKAKELIDRVVKARKKLDDQKLYNQRYDLIGEIKEHYPLEEFFKSRVDNYKEYASVYKVFEAEKDDKEIYNPADVVRSEDTLVEHITSDTSEPTKEEKLKEARSKEIEEYKNQSKDLRLYAQKLMIERFNDRYNGLNGKQKKLLRKYINNISNTNNLREYVDSEAEKLKETLSSLQSKIEDTVTKTKVKEASELIGNVKNGQHVSEDQVTKLLMYYQLQEKIKNQLQSQ